MLQLFAQELLLLCSDLPQDGVFYSQLLHLTWLQCLFYGSFGDYGNWASPTSIPDFGDCGNRASPASIPDFALTLQFQRRTLLWLYVVPYALEQKSLVELQVELLLEGGLGGYREALRGVVDGSLRSQIGPVVSELGT